MRRRKNAGRFRITSAHRREEEHGNAGRTQTNEREGRTPRHSRRALADARASDPRAFSAHAFRGVRIALHTHPWAQVAYTSRGVLRVATVDSTWIVPPSRAIWVDARGRDRRGRLYAYAPRRCERRAAGPRRVSCGRGVTACCVKSSPRSTTHRSRVSGNGYSARSRWMRSSVRNRCRSPCRCRTKNACARSALCDAVLAADPSNSDLERWSSEAGESTRTIARLFRRELGVSEFLAMAASRAGARDSVTEPRTAARASRT